MSKRVLEPWASFLKDVDEQLPERTEIHCLGGFVVTVIFGSARSTRDLDALPLIGQHSVLWDLAGKGSDLHKRHNVYLDRVGISPLPENYEDRLSEVFPGVFRHLRLLALDPYDVALAKIERNSARDREDVLHLARVVPFDIKTLNRRYHEELRPYLGNPDREDLTLRLWTEMIEETRNR
jgi:hypothetical protein